MHPIRQPVPEGCRRGRPMFQFLVEAEERRLKRERFRGRKCRGGRTVVGRAGDWQTSSGARSRRVGAGSRTGDPAPRRAGDRRVRVSRNTPSPRTTFRGLSL